jgi:hypothetical protein
MGEICVVVVVAERSKSWRGIKNPDFALVRIVWTFLGGSTGAARWGRVGERGGGGLVGGGFGGPALSSAGPDAAGDGLSGPAAGPGVADEVDPIRSDPERMSGAGGVRKRIPELIRCGSAVAGGAAGGGVAVCGGK